MTTLLVIEDHYPTLQYLDQLFSTQGFRVITANNGVRGLEQAQVHLPDVIISDLDMPEMDGFEVLRNLRQSLATQQIPVIICSGTKDPTTQCLALALGASAYIPKPFDDQFLQQLIQEQIHALHHR